MSGLSTMKTLGDVSEYSLDVGSGAVGLGEGIVFQRRPFVAEAGQAVQQGEVLVELEASDLLALADQARAALLVAETRRDKARLDRDRSEALVQQGAAAPERLDTDRATFRAAEAEVERARQSVTGAESALAFATVRAPISGCMTATAAGTEWALSVTIT